MRGHFFLSLSCFSSLLHLFFAMRCNVDSAYLSVSILCIVLSWTTHLAYSMYNINEYSLRAYSNVRWFEGMLG